MTNATISFKCIPVQQGVHTLYVFSASAKELWEVVSINLRDTDKDIGYQRVLSPSRLKSITKYVSAGKPVPTSILISFTKGVTVSPLGDMLTVNKVADAGWVIDGQHRLAGAHQSPNDIELPVVAFLELDDEAQIEQFVTINKEAKGVPTSLYYDLLSHLPKKTAADVAKERAADLASELKRDEDSPFYGRIVVTTTPIKGELSLNNFVRKVAPLLMDGRALSVYSLREQSAILSNYFSGLRVAFPSKFSQSSIFFQTLGFGALINALPTAMGLCLKNYQAFKVSDVAKLFGQISHFDFDVWSKMGTGSSAELQAGEDLKQELKTAYEEADGGAAKTIDLGI